MFNKIKKLAKKVVNKTKELVKYISEKAEEYIMSKELIKLKKMELVVNKIRDDKNRLILGLVFLGLGGSLIASVYIPAPYMV